MSKTIPEAPKPTVQHPTVGRIVLFQLKAKDGVVTRPAIVVHIFAGTDDQSGLKDLNGKPLPYINVQVFTDESNDGLPGVVWGTSAKYSEAGEAGTWHWMPYQVAKPAADAALVNRVDDLTAQLEALAKDHGKTAKVVSQSLRDFTKVQPKDIHEAIQRLKAEGSTLGGAALRQAAGEKFLGWKPKPSTAKATAKPADKA